MDHSVHLTPFIDVKPFNATVFVGAQEGRIACERTLIQHGTALPLPQRSIWKEIDSATDSLFIGLQDARGEWVFGIGAQVHPTRALANHLILRVQRFRGASDPAICEAVVRALAAASRSHGRVLRTHVEVLARDAATREVIQRSFRNAGFRRSATMRSYAETVVIDLAPDLDSIFASLHATARRHIRAVDKHPTTIREISDPSYAGRMDELLRETMARTDGPYEMHDWAHTIRFCTRYPETARIVGLFHEESSGPESLLAFAVGYAHGDHVEYATAASTRMTSLKMPLAYGLAWDLVCWGKRVGAKWFDFGGVTRGSAESGDPRGGVSDFKRYFSREVIRVGEEWVLVPHPLRAALARTTSTAARVVRSFSR